jgi:hypothetical protein
MNCAQALATGPFHGFFHEGATLYRLIPPCIAGGPTKKGVQSCEVSHVIVSGLDAERDSGPETVIFASDETGVIDSDFYLKHGVVLEVFGKNDPAAALARLGYSL